MLIKRYFSTVAKITGKDLKSNPEFDFLITKDLYRVDVGLIISRRPVYWNISDEELESLKQTHKLFLKHDLYPPVYEDYMKYDKKELLNLSEGRDEYVTHRKRSGKTRVDYRENTKRFEYVDPKILDNNSIQHASLYETYLLVKKDDRWQFPTVPMTTNINFETMKENYFNKIADEWSVAHINNFPLAVKREPMPESEKSSNLINTKCVGRKIFFFNAYHNAGAIKFKRDYSEYTWATKLELSKFVNKEDFDFYAGILRPN